MEHTVLLTISGDAGDTEDQADTTVPLSQLLARWAQKCSTQAPEDLVAVSGDNTTLFDPATTLGDLGLGYGSVIRLVTTEEAIGVLDVETLDAPPPVDQAPASPDPAPTPPATPPAPLHKAHAGAQAPDRPPWRLPSGRRLEDPPSPARPARSGAAPYSTPPPASRPPWQASTPPPAAAAAAAAAAEPTVMSPPPWPGTIGGAPPVPTHPEDAKLPPKVAGGQRLWRALRAGVSPKSVPARHSGAFAKATHPGASDRYRLALQETDRCHNLETMIRTAVLTRCMVIAVVSPKGGPGKTTISALLGMLLAELRRDPVLALDANPDLGDLRDKLAAETAAATLVDDLARWLDEHPTATPAELSSRLGVGPHGLRFVPTPRPPEASKERMIAAANFDLYQRLIARLRDYEGIILVDCGTGLLDPPVRAALEAADQTVLVTDSSATTARQVVAAAGLLPPDTPTWLVANKMPERGSMLDLAQVVAAIPRLNGVTVVPVPGGGRLAENIVTPAFTWAESPSSWREPVREIAARLANNWGTLR